MINDEAHEHHETMKIKKQQRMKQEAHPNSLSTEELISVEPCRVGEDGGTSGKAKG